MAAHPDTKSGQVESLPGLAASPGSTSVLPFATSGGNAGTRSELASLTAPMPSIPPPATSELVGSSICTKYNPIEITDKEALRLLSSHPGLAQQYQDLTAARLKDYMKVIDASYKERLRQLEKDFESFKKAVSKLGQVGQDRPIGMNAHERTLLQWEGPLHNGGSFTAQLPKVSPAWYRPITNTESGHTQPDGGLSLPPVPHPLNMVTPLTVPSDPAIQKPVPPEQSCTTRQPAPELAYLKVDGPLAGSFRLALNGLAWEHPGKSLVLQASPATSTSRYTGLFCTAEVTPKITDFVIERTPENLLLLLEAHHRLRDRKLQLTNCWRRQGGHPAPKKVYVYEGQTTPASKLWRERTRYKPFANLAVKVPVRGTTDPRLAFNVLFRIEMRRLLFSRGVVQGRKKPQSVSYIDVLSGQHVRKQKNDIVFPESELYLSMLAHFAKSLLPTELSAMELAKTNHETGVTDNLGASQTYKGSTRPRTDTSQAQSGSSGEVVVSKENNPNALHRRENSSTFLQSGIRSTILNHLRSIPAWPGIKPLIGLRAGKDDKQPATTDHQVKPTQSRQAVKPATSNSAKNTRTNKRAAVDDPVDHVRPSKSLKVSARPKVEVKPTIKLEDVESVQTCALPPKPTWVKTDLARSNSLPGHSLKRKQSTGPGRNNGHYGYHTSQATQSSQMQQARRPYHDYDRPPAYEQYKYDQAESLITYGDPPQPFATSKYGRLDCEASI